jgi:hypothetical protein
VDPEVRVASVLPHRRTSIRHADQVPCDSPIFADRPDQGSGVLFGGVRICVGGRTKGFLLDSGGAARAAGTARDGAGKR